MVRSPRILARLSLLVACDALGRAPAALATEPASREDVGRAAGAGVFPFADVLYVHDFKPLGGVGAAFNGLGVATGIEHVFWLGRSGGPAPSRDVRLHGLGLSAGVRGALLAASCPDCGARATGGALVKLSYLGVDRDTFSRANLDSVEAYVAYSPWIGTDRLGLGGVRETVSGSRLMLGAALPNWTPRFVETMLAIPWGGQRGSPAAALLTAPLWVAFCFLNQIELSVDLPHCKGPGCAARLGLSTGYHW
jgi:hypothetical protein